MKKQALVLGLTSVLYTFVFLPLLGLSLYVPGLNLPFPLIHLGSLAAGFVTALILAPVVEGEAEPPALLVKLLLFTAAYFLVMKAINGLGWHLPFSKFALLVDRGVGWAQMLVILLVTRLLKPRLMLLVGLTAFAMQFNAIGVALPLVFNLPKVLLTLVSLIVAIGIAWAFSQGEDSAADRVRNPFYLWFFAAAGSFVLLMSDDSIWLRNWQENLVRLVFLASFVLLVDNIDSDELEPKAQGLGAGYGTLIPIFIAMFLVVTVVFEIHELINSWLPWTWREGGRFWLPLLGCAGVAFGVMKLLKLSHRLPEYGPGRKLVLWGAILYGVSLLAGGSLFGGMSDDGGSLEFLVVFVYFAILVVPIVTMAVILAGTGLLRILFSLNARPRG